MTAQLSKRVIKEISKLEKSIRDSIFDYLKYLEQYSMIDIYEHGAKDLKGNLKGLIRFKYKTFSNYRLVGKKNGETIVIFLCCEPRNKVYKNKDEMAKEARKQ